MKSLSLKVPLPRTLPRSAAAKVAAAIQAHLDAIDALLAFLDDADGDPDAEAEVEEPSHGSVEPRLFSMGSFASHEPGLNQERWSAGGSGYDEREPDEHCDRPAYG